MLMKLIKSVNFKEAHIANHLMQLTETHAAFGVFLHNIGQYSFCLPFNKKIQVAFSDMLSKLTFLAVVERGMY